MSETRDDPAAFLDDVSAAATPVAAPADDGPALAAKELNFEDRYRVWRGRSGRRYLVTVMPLGEAVAVENGVLLLVALDGAGERRVVWAGETGASLPGLAVAPGAQLEAHVHLLAGSAGRRAEALADLFNGAERYSSVLTVSEAASQARVGSTTPRRSSSRAVLTT
ncbi:hypothetical protein [Hansschlegelia beijingensis]|uniref:Uncharacterized protein n=1 Tax=Hansschlegelia beijingensis TaxID=1133344 RepID=A0A7W6D6E2_9HYPH|nr:hypothetical protein [Hansschlegelia beijingensis]MBB3973978.1 hypothetical protein [Hansschlegelia beijingensis]